jgi:hypothetical protein
MQKLIVDLATRTERYVDLTVEELAEFQTRVQMASAAEASRQAEEAITAAQTTEARDYHSQLDAAIGFVEGALTAWPTMTTTQRTSWIRDNFDKVLRIDLGLLRMVRWAARRLGIG